MHTIPIRRLLCLTVIVSLSSTARIEAQIIPGDTNRDNQLTIADGVRLLTWLTADRGLDICYNAADVNADGSVDISDAVFILSYMFGGGAAPRDIGSTDCDSPDNPTSGPGDDLDPATLRATVLSPVSAAIAWRTAAPASSLVRYGTSASLLAASQRVDALERRHRVALTGLRPATTYYYQSTSTTRDGTRSVSPIESFRTLPEYSVNVRPGHPRLFLRAEDIPEIFSRIENDSVVRGRWQDLLTLCDSYLDESNRVILEDFFFRFYIRAFSFAALLTGDHDYTEKAIALGIELATGNYDKEDRFLAEALAYVYDWQYNDLDSVERRILEGALWDITEILDDRSRDSEFVIGAHTIRRQFPLTLGAFALADDVPEARGILETLVRRLHYGFLSTRRFFAEDGGSEQGWWYSAYNAKWLLQLLAAWHSASGQDWFQREEAAVASGSESWLRRWIRFLPYGLRGDGTFLRMGDARVFAGIVRDHRINGLILAKYLKSPEAMWLAERGRPNMDWSLYAVDDLLWHDSRRASRRPNWPLTTLFENVGTAIFRSGWGDDATLASFRAEPFYIWGHNHRDNCSFTLFHRGDLALDSGIYDDFGGSHHRNYYSRTIAHNTITVFDPSEEFSIFGNSYANDGGQFWPQKDDDVPTWWPETIEAALAPQNGFRSPGMVRFERRAGYTYAMADGTPYYRAKKLRKFHRHFLWLNDVRHWDEPVVVVFDDVIAASASYVKRYLLHTQNAPTISGTRVVASEGDGVLYQHTVLPSNPRIERIGGSGREFLVDGTNYPPSSSARENEIPGNWRVEVRPPVAQNTDHFLHVLYPGDRGVAAPPAPLPLLSGTTLKGARVGRWNILFDADEPDDSFQFFNLSPNGIGLIMGLAPNTEYGISINHGVATPRTTSSEGTLQFDIPYSGMVSVTRR